MTNNQTVANQSSSNVSQAATRDGFGQGLVEAAKQNRQIIGVCADLTGSLRMTEFENQFPDRFVQVGVAEQNLIGVAAGLALRGKIPFAASFAAFSPGRSFDQIRVSVAYSNLNVIIVGGHAGIATGPDGATHQMLSDIAMMRALPNMTVVQPCDAQQARQAVHALANQTGPAYLRLSRPKTAVVSKPSMEFNIGQAQILRQGVDLTLMASGLTVHTAFEISHILSQKNISVRLINFHTLKPIDKPKIIHAANETGVILTIEDHQINGGLGSAVAEVLAEEQGRAINHIVKFKRIGINNQFGESGGYTQLYQKFGLSTDNIIHQIQSIL